MGEIRGGNQKILQKSLAARSTASLGSPKLAEICAPNFSPASPRS